MRECGTCNLCCKVVAVEALEKPVGVWCVHARPGAGCSIYGRHPDECKTFHCAWLTSPELGEDWKPSASKLVIVRRGNGTFVHVDPSSPGAWKKPAFYPRLKQLARGMWDGSAKVLIYEGRRTTVIFPEEDLYIGEIGVGDVVHVGYVATAYTRQPHVMVEPAGGEKFEKRGGLYPNRNPV